jgi:hypothetical protein
MKNFIGTVIALAIVVTALVVVLWFAINIVAALQSL